MVLPYPKPNQGTSLTATARLRNRYSLVILLLSGILVFAQGYDGDLSYWVGWITHLTDKGYTDFSANYPPVYIHWLWLVSKCYSFFDFPLARDHLLKLFVLLPVVVCHVWFLRLVTGLSAFKIQSPRYQHMLMALLALNPAIYFNGAIWGQVDLLPNLIVIVALIFCLQGKNVVWVPALCALAFLTKFQMIVFAPIFAGFMFRYWREYLKGILPLGLVVLLVLLPYLLAGNTLNMLHHAYLDTVSQYPYLTFNAANFWYWFAGNMVSDELGVKKIAFGLFVIISCVVMLGVARAKSSQRLLDWANIMPITFFIVLPGMHERYLFAAIPLAILWGCFNPARLPWALLVSVFCTLNMLLAFPLQGELAWWMLSVGIMGLFVCFWAQVIFPARYFARVNQYVLNRAENFNLSEIKTAFFWLLLIALFALKQSMSVVSFELADNEKLLTGMPVISSHQSYSTLKINTSVEGKPLTVEGNVYAHGFGTHAASNIVFHIPPGATGFKSIVALDDEAKAGELQFQVFVDGALRWQSGTLNWLETTDFCEIQLHNNKTLVLKVLSLESNSHDHADWINPVFVFAKETSE